MLARVDALLTRERVRNYSVIFLVLATASLVVSWLVGPLWGHRPGPPFLPDYLAHWTGGRLILAGKVNDLYDLATQAHLQSSAVPGARALAWFVSPPADALLYLPLAGLPYLASATMWLGLSVALLAICLRLTRALLGPRRQEYGLFVLVVLAMPATLEVLGSGQDSLVVLLLWISALLMLQRGSELRGGALLGLGALKPQLVLLVPFMLLGQRRFKALCAFLVVSGATVAVTLAMVGPDGLLRWTRTLSSPTYTAQVQRGQAWKMQSLSALSSVWTSSLVPAALILVLGAIVVLVTCRRLFSDVASGFALTSLVTVLCSPHVLIYDCVLLLPGMAYALDRFNRPSVRVLALLVFVLQWTAPVRHVLAGALGHSAALDAPWVSLAFAALLCVCVRTRSSEKQRAAGGYSGERAKPESAHAKSVDDGPREGLVTDRRAVHPPEGG